MDGGDAAGLMAFLQAQLRELESSMGGVEDAEARGLLDNLSQALAGRPAGAGAGAGGAAAVASKAGAATASGAAGRGANPAKATDAAADAAPGEEAGEPQQALAGARAALTRVEAELSAFELAVSSTDGDTRAVLMTALRVAGVGSVVEGEEEKEEEEEAEAAAAAGGAAGRTAAADKQAS